MLLQGQFVWRKYSLCIYSLFCSKYKLSFQIIKNDDVPGIRIAVIMTYYTLSCTVTLNIADIINWYSASWTIYNIALYDNAKFTI